jgi:hypothetical protein
MNSKLNIFLITALIAAAMMSGTAKSTAMIYIDDLTDQIRLDNPNLPTGFDVVTTTAIGESAEVVGRFSTSSAPGLSGTNTVFMFEGLSPQPGIGIVDDIIFSFWSTFPGPAGSTIAQLFIFFESESDPGFGCLFLLSGCPATAPLTQGIF